MPSRRTLAAFALASLLAFPTFASASIVQKWATAAGANYAWVPQVSGDLQGNGSFELVTIEVQAGGTTYKIGIRSASTGQLLGQSAGTYTSPGNFQLADVDGNGTPEILFTASNTSLVCMNYNAGTVTQRFKFNPTPSGVPALWSFADLDGNGHEYTVFRDDTPGSNNWYVFDYNGVAVTTIFPSGAPSGSNVTKQLTIADIDADGRQEIVIDYDTHSAAGDVLYVYESNAPAPMQSAATQAPISKRTPPRVAPAFVDVSR